MMYPLLRKALFQLDPEVAHEVTLLAWQGVTDVRAEGLVSRRRIYQPCTVMGLTFPNRVGLAAGLDKNADYITALGRMGFGFLEVGTITPRPQAGNPKPRLFRLPEAEAIINRMGFNNKGVAHLVKKLCRHQFDGPVGVNIGKNAATPLEQAHEDYLICLKAVYPHADYIAINISSPNTPGLRTLQHATTLEGLLTSLLETRHKLAEQHGRTVPLAVKLAPDLSDEELTTSAEILARLPIEAVIATNTTLNRAEVAGLPHAEEQGGLSGRPLRARATAVIRQLRGILPPEKPIIAVGGIMSGADAVEKIEAGAELVQIYTGLIYRGPELVAEIAEALKRG
jgi:dihydroorotate dehydrogenase